MALNIRNPEANRLAAQVACLAGETKTDAVILALADHCALSASSLVDSIVIEARYGSDGQGDLDLFFNTAQISIVSLDREQAEIARAAFARYGKGRHRASLNLADCFSYALAQWLEQPLLFN